MAVPLWESPKPWQEHELQHGTMPWMCHEADAVLLPADKIAIDGHKVIIVVKRYTSYVETKSSVG